MNEVTVKNDTAQIEEVKNTCKLLMDTPHYSKLGREGIFAIVSKAKSVGVDPLHALDGGMYYVNGKVEMSSQMMNSVIRQHNHSISKDPTSDHTVCILHGKRADNGDTWTESFSIEDAKNAGLAGKDVWKKFPKDMLFARALSRLSRQLFPDIIRGCYVEGEISPLIEDKLETNLIENVVKLPSLMPEQVAIIEEFLMEFPESKRDMLSRYKATEVSDIPYDRFDEIIKIFERKKKTKLEAAI